MKRILLLLLTFSLAAVLTSCVSGSENNPADSGSNTGTTSVLITESSSDLQVFTMLCTVEQVNGSRLTVKENNESESLYSVDLASLESFDETINVGDYVSVTYKYPIEETYPMGIVNLVDVKKISESEASTLQAVTSAPSAVSDEKTTASKTTASKTTTVKAAAAKVSVVYLDGKSSSSGLTYKESQIVNGIIGRTKFSSTSYDNVSDYKITVDGVVYYYDSSTGIITKDDTHADILSSEDKASLNNILENHTSSAPKVSLATIVTDTFIIKQVNGTSLVLARYDRNNGEYKEGLYSCNIRNLDGSADMKFNVGDVVTVRYDLEVGETYPMQLTVREIYPAEWN